MSTPEERRRDIVRMKYLCELVAVQGEGLAKNLRELADICERSGGFTPESLASVRDLADTLAFMKTLANTNGGAE